VGLLREALLATWFTRACVSALLLVATVPATANAACPSPKPDQSFCGDATCGSVVCTADNSWDCAFSVAGTACTGGRCDGAGTCTLDPVGHKYSPSCGCIDGNWSAPRGALVLISTPDSAVAQIVSALNEVYTHEMISQGLQSAAQSEFKQPDTASS